MAPWTERFKATFGRKKPSTSRLGEASSTSTTPRASAATDLTAPSPSLPERLWNQAYEQAKAADLNTVDTYETILSSRLSHGDADPTDLASQQNEIEQNPEKRWIQMHRLVQDGLHRTEKEANVKQGMEDGIQAAMAVKEVVDKAIKAAPEAALAWVGVCFVLEILMNPLTQASSNRQGIAYVVSRMDWYWNLSGLLLDENITEAHSQGLRGELEKNITHLYAKLLLYQMKSVRYYHRGRLFVFARDLVKLDNWDDELNDIQAAEAAVQRDSAQYNTLSIRSRLGSIAETAKSQNVKLNSISSAIREQTKQQERMHETGADNKCLADLRSTDPRHDKTRIEDIKGGLLEGSYLWILENSGFQQWRNDPQSRLLWIKADPGKGKTMLLCGIINELKKSMAQTGFLSYFFCQATDSRINNATAVLRGLMFLLIDQQPSLISHIRKKYDRAGKTLFEDANAWVALSEIFTNILQDPSLNNTYLVVDALDECVTNLPKLLDFIVQKSSVSSRIKWIVSSRNWPDIEKRLERAEQKVRLSLELNAESVSTAVNIFIQHKVLQLTKKKNYNKKTRDDVLDHLSSNANNTFLWVALACQNLETIPQWDVPAKLKTFPPGLDSLYEQMMQYIYSSDNANLWKRILTSIAIVYRPITLKELTFLVEELKNVIDDPESLREIIGLCGSFLTLREDTIYFVHQSAKEFLLTKAFNEIFPSGKEEAHYVVFSRSLRVLSRTLRRDIYSLRALGYDIERVKQPDPDPLAASRYSCVYWVDHLCDSAPLKTRGQNMRLQDSDSILGFLEKHFLHWLEALSLLGSISSGVLAMRMLEDFLGPQQQGRLVDFIRDAHRFILSQVWILERSPLQVYTSALTFCPVRSLVREQFKTDEPDWITMKPVVESDWSPCLLTIQERGSIGSKAIALSQDGEYLASTHHENTINIWDVATGTCIRTLRCDASIASLAFSYTENSLAGASEDGYIHIWEITRGQYVRKLQGHDGNVRSVRFSPKNGKLASASADGTIRIWEVATAECNQIFECHGEPMYSVAFSHDGNHLASGSDDGTVRIWEVVSGECKQILKGHSAEVTSVAFSHNNKQLASGSSLWDNTIRIWDVAETKCVKVLRHHSYWIDSVVFLNDKHLASAGGSGIIYIWDTATWQSIRTLDDHGGSVRSLAFYPGGKRLASTSDDNTIRIWDVPAAISQQTQTIHRHMEAIESVSFSYDGRYLASASYDHDSRIWEVATGQCIQKLEGHTANVSSAVFSPDSQHIASAAGGHHGNLKLWKMATGTCMHTLEGHSVETRSIAFSPDSKYLASCSIDKTIRVWDVARGVCMQTLQGHTDWIKAVAFSDDGKYLASAADDRAIHIWGLVTSPYTVVRTFKNTSESTTVVFSHDSDYLVSASVDQTIEIWDIHKGQHMQTIHIGRIIKNISFDANNNIVTDIGNTGICLFSSSMPSDTSQVTDADSGIILARNSREPQEPKWLGYGFSTDYSWITRNGQKVLWLPPDYRPSCSAMLGHTVAAGCQSRRVFFMSFSDV